MEFESVYDLAQHYSKQHRDILYPARPEIPPRPKRENFPNNETFGRALDEWEVLEKREKDSHRKKVKEYDQLTSKNEMEFKRALLAHLGISKHKKAEKLWSMAWDEGRSTGFSEVAQIAENLSELIRD